MSEPYRQRHTITLTFTEAELRAALAVMVANDVPLPGDGKPALVTILPAERGQRAARRATEKLRHGYRTLREVIKE